MKTLLSYRRSLGYDEEGILRAKREGSLFPIEKTVNVHVLKPRLIPSKFCQFLPIVIMSDDCLSSLVISVSSKDETKTPSQIVSSLSLRLVRA